MICRAVELETSFDGAAFSELCYFWDGRLGWVLKEVAMRAAEIKKEVPRLWGMQAVQSEENMFLLGTWNRNGAE